MSNVEIQARKLLIMAFPGDALRAGRLLVELAGGRLSSQSLYSLVQEHCEENHIPIHGPESTVVVSGLSKICADDTPAETFDRFGVYFNPITRLACKVDFASMTIVESEPFDLTPDPLRDRLMAASHPSMHVFAPPAASPIFISIFSSACQEPVNFCSSTEVCKFDFQPTRGKLFCSAASAELRALSWEDGVVRLALSVRFAEPPYLSTPEEAGEWTTKCLNERLGGESLLEMGSTALKNLRRQLPVHKQRFDWNLNRVVGLLPNS